MEYLSTGRKSISILFLNKVKKIIKILIRFEILNWMYICVNRFLRFYLKYGVKMFEILKMLFKIVLNIKTKQEIN